MTPLNLAPTGTDLGGTIAILAGLAIILITCAAINYTRNCIRRHKALKQQDTLLV